MMLLYRPFLSHSQLTSQPRVWLVGILAVHALPTAPPIHPPIHGSPPCYVDPDIKHNETRIFMHSPQSGVCCKLSVNNRQVVGPSCRVASSPPYSCPVGHGWHFIGRILSASSCCFFIGTRASTTEPTDRLDWLVIGATHG